MTKSLPTRALRENPDIEQLKRQAKELLQAFRSLEPDAVAEVNAHYHGAEAAAFALHDAQLVLARAYGFDSWPKLKAYVDGVTVARLADAVLAGDLKLVRAMLEVRPELARMDMAENNEHQALHYAVLARNPEMVRLLMRSGANPRKGIYPHRDATTALTFALERGYDEIADIIRQEEGQGGKTLHTDHTPPPLPPGLMEAARRGDEAGIIAALEANPWLAGIHFQHPLMTPLHSAAAMLWDRVLLWLLDHGADVNARGDGGPSPLEIVGCSARTNDSTPEKIAGVASILRSRGAELTARAAVVLRKGDWLRAQHAAGKLENTIGDNGGLIFVAVENDLPDMLALLLELGLDPDERVRLDGVEEVVYSGGGPLHHCAGSGKLAMAETLLARGANPNLHVYAAGPPIFKAYEVQDSAMVALLEKYGAVVDASTAGVLRLTDKARQLLEDEAAGRLREETHAPGWPLVEELLFYGADGGDPEIVRMALDRLDWPREDPRWHGILMRNLGNHKEPDRRRHFHCFRLILERCDPGIPGKFGRTILHDLAADWPHPSPGAEERVEFTRLVLDRHPRLDVRDDLLKSTPLGWACRWGRIELVQLLLDRGADPVETEAEPWATPRAWAEKRRHDAILELLRGRKP